MKIILIIIILILIIIYIISIKNSVFLKWYEGEFKKGKKMDLEFFNIVMFVFINVFGKIIEKKVLGSFV